MLVDFTEALRGHIDGKNMMRDYFFLRSFVKLLHSLSDVLLLMEI